MLFKKNKKIVDLTQLSYNVDMNYPNKRIKNAVVHKQSNANRGMTLEYEINITNKYYLDSGIANIHKKPTPVQIVTVDYPKRSAAKITEAYFKLPSTTDYNGLYNGKYIDFEAKECSNMHSFPFSSIHAHQIQHLKSILSLKGICFLIIRFSAHNKTFYVSAKNFIDFYENASRKSIPYTWFLTYGIEIPFNFLKPVDYLKVVQNTLEDNYEN